MFNSIQLKMFLIIDIFRRKIKYNLGWIEEVLIKVPVLPFPLPPWPYARPWPDIFFIEGKLFLAKILLQTFHILAFFLCNNKLQICVFNV